jgi:hypothetical protein
VGKIKALFNTQYFWNVMNGPEFLGCNESLQVPITYYVTFLGKRKVN